MKLSPKHKIKSVFVALSSVALNVPIPAEQEQSAGALYGIAAVHA